MIYSIEIERLLHVFDTEILGFMVKTSNRVCYIIFLSIYAHTHTLHSSIAVNGLMFLCSTVENGQFPDPSDWAVTDVVDYFKAAGFEEQATAFKDQVE